MLTLPSKPWKRVEIRQATQTDYVIRVLSPLKEPRQFDRMVSEDLEPCLGPGDRLTEPSWQSRSVRLITEDLASFKKRLVFQGIVVEKSA